MYRFVSPRRVAVAMAVVAVLGFAGPVAADGPKRFKGQYEGDVTITPLAPPFVKVDIDGSGKASHLGKFTVEIPHIVNRANRTAVGSYQFTTRNGDTLTADFTGQSTPIAGTAILYIVETATITGGTGRFAGATGSFVAERLFDTIALTTAGSFKGTIRLGDDDNDEDDD